MPLSSPVFRIRGAVCLTFLLLLPATALAVRHPEDTWTAHPPLHIGRHAADAPAGYSPLQIRHAYGFDLIPETGKGQTIGIVDAFDAPTIASDLGTFIATFHLQTMHGLPGTGSCTVAAGPHPCFQKLFSGKKPVADAGWALETSLDVEWAHAVAPGADILLVETPSSALTGLLGGVDAASSRAHVVSMSWGGPEFANERAYDAHFRKAGTAFLASSGDNGTGQSYPAASPDVIAVGGTTLPLDAQGNSTGKEKGWQGSGGGISNVESEPAYQTALAIISGGKRAGPDVSYDGDPATGVSVYDSTPSNGESGWYGVGGTSAAAPQWAGIIALADEGRNGSALATNMPSQSFVYDAATVPGAFRDIRSGTNGRCGAQCKATAGYDLVTGLGSPAVATLVPALGRK